MEALQVSSLNEKLIFNDFFQPSGSHRGSKTNLNSDLEQEDKVAEAEGKLKVCSFLGFLIVLQVIIFILCQYYKLIFLPI